MWVWILFIAYFIELVVLFGGIAYVTGPWLKRQNYVNPHLSGRRLKVAALIPFGWFIYIYTDAYAVYDLLKLVKTVTPEIESALKQKTARQVLSLVIGTINTMVLTGHKFGEE